MPLIFLSILLALSLQSSAAAPSPDATFKYVCEYADFFYDVQCGDLEPPVIVLSSVVSNQYYGFYYSGEKYIFVNPRFSARQQVSTIVHETMHYVLDWRSKTRVSRCDSEERSRRVQKSWAGEKYNDDWRKRYRCEIE